MVFCWFRDFETDFVSVDIVACPDYLTWGVSFDDGPSVNSTPISLSYLFLGGVSDDYVTF